ncbi:hypothetical protein FNV43_RR05324 [Rhamnella rubrinervis]|uniref:Uncharacterized protein n=1 Tax=Rhamnella rubrinervis TaxID=2594499 RepID=A0A8K0HL47_9ROSA|nr:hypothetical protein FNV43_RR05324 [Rhamnella rubrinervis]
MQKRSVHKETLNKKALFRGKYIRVRVDIPVNEPLTAGFFQLRGNGEEFWIQLKAGLEKGSVTDKSEEYGKDADGDIVRDLISCNPTIEALNLTLSRSFSGTNLEAALLQQGLANGFNPTRLTEWALQMLKNIATSRAQENSLLEQSINSFENDNTRELGCEIMEAFKEGSGPVRKASGLKDGPSPIITLTQRKRVGLYLRGESSKERSLLRQSQQIVEEEGSSMLIVHETQSNNEEFTRNFMIGNNNPSPIRTRSWRQQEETSGRVERNTRTPYLSRHLSNGLQVTLCRRKWKKDARLSLSGSTGIPYANVSSSLAEGLVLMWNSEVDIQQDWSNERTICASILNPEGEQLWKIVACYGPPHYKDK